MRRTTPYNNMLKFALPTLVLLSVLIPLFIFSEPVRAKTMVLIRIVAGYVVDERDESPLKDLDQGESNVAQPNSTSAIVVAEATPVSPTKVEPTIYTVPTLPVNELLENPPFQFSFPAWVPNGFTLDETVGIAASNNWVSFVWNNSNHCEIELLIERAYTGYKIPAGVNSSEEIEISGKPALLIRGSWNGQDQWDPRRAISLDWEKDGHHYRLNYSERGPVHNEMVSIQGDMDQIIDQLVKMAESTP